MRAKIIAVPHESIKNAIVVEHHSGFERTFYVIEDPRPTNGAVVDIDISIRN